jgi:type IV secretion system protein TrbE
VKIHKLSPYDSESLAQIGQRINNPDRRPCAELVPWLFPYDTERGQIVNKDSGVAVTFEFSGPDSDSVSTYQILEMLEHFVSSLRDLGRRPVTMWWTVHRRRTSYYPTLPMPDGMSQRIDDERRRTFEAQGNYANRHYFTIVLRPEVGIDRFAGRVVHGVTHDDLSIPRAVWQATRATFSDQYLFAYTASELPAVIDAFESTVNGFVASNGNLTAWRLTGKRLGAFMHNVCSPPTDDVHELDIPDTPALDLEMCDTEVAVGHDYLHFYSNGRCRFGIAAGVPGRRDFWAKRVSTRSLDGLLKIKGELTISHCFRLTSQSTAKRFIDSIRKYHEGRSFDVRALFAAALKGGDASNQRKSEARTQAAKDANRRAGRVEMGEEQYGFYNLSVISYSDVYEETPDNVHEAAPKAYAQAVTTHKAVEEVLRGAQFTPVRETLHALSAFATTIPGMWRECARWSFIDTEVLSRLLPLRGVSAGNMFNRHLSRELRRRIPALAAFATEYGTPFWFTGYMMDLGHMLICGRSGFGKTIFMLLCATLFRKYPNLRIYGFDLKLSMRIPTLLQRGRYLQFEADPNAVAADERGTCGPLMLLEHERHLPFLMDWICMLVGQRGYRATADDRMELEKALRAAQASPDRKLWRLQAIYSSLGKNTQFAKELATWVGSSVDAHYFDNLTDSFSEAEWVTVATDKIMSNKAVARPFLSYATYRIRDSLGQRRAHGDIGPTIIMLPEIWNLLDDEDFAHQIGGWIVMMRSLLGNVWMDAQTPEQMSSSSIWPAIRDNVAIRVFVPVKDFKPSTKTAFERHFGQGEAQIEALKKCRPKQDYFLSEDGGISRRISVPLSIESEAILRSESSSQVLLDRHMRSGDPNWRENYFKEAVEQIRREREAVAREEERHNEDEDDEGKAA